MRRQAHGEIYVWSRLQESVPFCTICVVAEHLPGSRHTIQVTRYGVHGVQIRQQRFDVDNCVLSPDVSVGKEGADN